jgi:hypothetical protein
MAQRLTQQQLESYLWGAAVLLRGTIDAGDDKQFIFPLLFYKRLCDVFDEETQTALAVSCKTPCVPLRPPTPTSSTASLATPNGPTRTASPMPCCATWSSTSAGWS